MGMRAQQHTKSASLLHVSTASAPSKWLKRGRRRHLGEAPALVGQQVEGAGHDHAHAQQLRHLGVELHRQILQLQSTPAHSVGASAGAIAGAIAGAGASASASASAGAGAGAGASASASASARFLPLTVSRD